MRAIIAGGGIGGLTAALCLKHFGHDPVVLERAAALDEAGAGIQLSPNAMKVFGKLGLTARLAALAFAPEANELRLGQSGKRIFEVPLGEAAIQRWGAPYLHIHRADLMQVLREALQERAPNALRLRAGVMSYRQSETGAGAILEDGTAATGDVVIGADGIRSTIREQMLGPDQARYTGNVAWRAVVPMDRLGDLAQPPTSCVWVGEGAHCVTYRLRGGALANFVGVVEQRKWTNESWTEEGDREEVLRDFVGWHPTLIKIIQEAETHYKWALFDRAPLLSWVDGRVALLGDSCHPMPPFMAQGAAMAIEDAWMLAKSLSTGGVRKGLQLYQSARLQRTADVQAASRANADLFHKRGMAARLATYGPMWLAGRLAPAAILTRLDKFYGYDVTANK